MKREHDTYRRAPDRRRNNRNSNLVSGIRILKELRGKAHPQRLHILPLDNSAGSRDNPFQIDHRTFHRSGFL